jgi:hypothetical protein
VRAKPYYLVPTYSDAVSSIAPLWWRCMGFFHAGWGRRKGSIMSYSSICCFGAMLEPTTPSNDFGAHPTTRGIRSQIVFGSILFFSSSVDVLPMVCAPASRQQRQQQLRFLLLDDTTRVCCYERSICSLGFRSRSTKGSSTLVNPTHHLSLGGGAQSKMAIGSLTILF